MEQPTWIKGRLSRDKICFESCWVCFKYMFWIIWSCHNRIWIFQPYFVWKSQHFQDKSYVRTLRAARVVFWRHFCLSSVWIFTQNWLSFSNPITCSWHWHFISEHTIFISKLWMSKFLVFHMEIMDNEERERTSMMILDFKTN